MNSLCIVRNDQVVNMNWSANTGCAQPQRIGEVERKVEEAGE